MKKEVDWYSNQLDKLKTRISKQLSNDKSKEMLVLKGHLLVEYYLNELTVVYLNNGGRKVGNYGFGFFNKIKELQKEKVLNNTEYNILHTLNKVRNNMSHQLDYSIDENDLDMLGSSLHSNYLGYDYLVEKYSSNNDKELLIKILQTIVIMVAVLSYKYYKDKKHANIN